MSIHVPMYFTCEFPGCESRTEELVKLIAERVHYVQLPRSLPTPTNWRRASWKDLSIEMGALLCEKHPAPNTKPTPTPQPTSDLDEPRTTDYCAQCGESPDSGTHQFGHDYVDPRVRCRTCLGDPRGELYDMDGFAGYRRCPECATPCENCGERDHMRCSRVLTSGAI